MLEGGAENAVHALLLAQVLQAMQPQSIPDGAKVRVTELRDWLMDRVEADSDCPNVPEVVIGEILGKMCTVIESKGTLVRVKRLAVGGEQASSVGPVWLPRVCVDHHKDRVRITADAAALKAAVMASITPSVHWQPCMEKLAGLDCDVLRRENGAVTVTITSTSGASMSGVLPEAVTEPVPDRCCGGLYPGQKVRATGVAVLLLHTIDGLKDMFGADGRAQATVQGHAADGNPRLVRSDGDRNWIGTSPRAFVAPLLQQGTSVALSSKGAADPRMRSFLKPGDTGLVVGFDDDGDPKVHVSGGRVLYVSQDFVVAAGEPAESTAPPPKRPRGDASPGGRPAVGDRVMLAPGGPTHRCLKPGDCGILEQDDGTIQPFKVRFNDETDWYREGEIIKAPVPPPAAAAAAQ